MAKKNTLDSKLENNCYVGMEVTLYKGENFEKLCGTVEAETFNNSKT